MSYEAIVFKNGQEPPINDVFLNNLQEAVVGLYENAMGVPIALFKDKWVEENGTYKQTATVDGLKADSNPMILLSSVDEEPTEDEMNAYLCLLDETIVEDGSITFVASEIPSISFTVIAKGVMASEGQAIADVTALVSKVNELENEIDGLNSDLAEEVIYASDVCKVVKKNNRVYVYAYGISQKDLVYLLETRLQLKPKYSTFQLGLALVSNVWKLIALVYVTGWGVKEYTASTNGFSMTTLYDKGDYLCHLTFVFDI